MSKVSHDYDVIVVGAGNTALLTALKAHEHGARVLVLEIAPKENRGGNAYYTTGIYRIVHNGIEDVRDLIPIPIQMQSLSTAFHSSSAGAGGAGLRIQPINAAPSPARENILPATGCMKEVQKAAYPASAMVAPAVRAIDCGGTQARRASQRARGTKPRPSSRPFTLQAASVAGKLNSNDPSTATAGAGGGGAYRRTATLAAAASAQTRIAASRRRRLMKVGPDSAVCPGLEWVSGPRMFPGSACVSPAFALRASARRRVVDGPSRRLGEGWQAVLGVSPRTSETSAGRRRQHPRRVRSPNRKRITKCMGLMKCPGACSEILYATSAAESEI